jgi:class 3 adenylate cyclase
MGTESRKLAAIVFADMVGFSALRQTVALELREAMMALATQELALHRGRLVNTMGDGFFAEFPTALDAVQFAVALQEAVEARNSASPEAARLRLRIGAHVGEVIIQGDNLLGENINIASRTEELAAPGGICMTNQVWEQVRDDLGARPRSLGKIRARHIQLPLTFYHIDPPGSGLRFRLAHRFRTGALGLGRIPVTAAILLMLCLLALLLWGQRRPRTAEAFFNRAGKASKTTTRMETSRAP